MSSSNYTNSINAIQLYGDKLSSQTTVNATLSNQPLLKARPSSIGTQARAGSFIIPPTVEQLIITSAVLSVPKSGPVFSPPTNLVLTSNNGYLVDGNNTITFTDNVGGATVTGYKYKLGEDTSNNFINYSGTLTPGSITIYSFGASANKFLQIQTVTASFITEPSEILTLAPAPSVNPPILRLVGRYPAARAAGNLTINITDRVIGTSVTAHQYSLSVDTSGSFITYTGSLSPITIPVAANTQTLQVKTITASGLTATTSQTLTTVEPGAGTYTYNNPVIETIDSSGNGSVIMTTSPFGGQINVQIVAYKYGVYGDNQSNDGFNSVTIVSNDGYGIITFTVPAGSSGTFQVYIKIVGRAGDIFSNVVNSPF
jgi:hypothetical protein